MVTLDVLLAEAPQEPPCGPNLEYDPDFGALDSALRGTPARWDGTKEIPGKDPEWPDVRERAEALLLRTKDLRVAVLLARALVKTEGAGGLATGLGLISGLLSRYWDHVHPGPDPGDTDPSMRFLALAPLADPDGLLRDVRTLTLVDLGTHGRIGVRDVLVALGKLPAVAGATVTDIAEITQIVRTDAAKNPAMAPAVLQARDEFVAILALLNEKAGDAPIPELSALKDALDAASRVCEPEAPAAEGAAADGAGPSVANASSGDIRTREDAVRHLERVCEFIQRTEPTNPAPLLIRRAMRLMTKDFMEIIEDLAPGSVSDIQKLAGLEQK